MFIISPRLGLCNQLQTIVKGILLSIKYKRNIYIHKFQIDLKSGNLCDINSILDIESINTFLQNVIKSPIRILNTIDENITNSLNNYYLPNIDYSKIQGISYINDTIDSNNHMGIIYLGNIVNLDIYKSFNYLWEDYNDKNMYYFIMANLKFNDIFYKIKDYVKQELNLTKFNCVHLRIEDDALNHFAYCYKLSVEEYNRELINFYNNNINMIRHSKTYVCSGMLEFDNKINFDYYNNLMKNNSLLCDKKNIQLDPYYLHNRELIAIIDLLIAYDSDYFIGCYISSFSQVIKCHHAYNNKKYIVFASNNVL